jgi:O-methyltransferase involved in polyketide biosynthesis
MATPAVDRRAAAADLRQDWPAALRQVGFDTDLPTGWVAEGLLHYLAPYAKHRLLDNVNALSTRRQRGSSRQPPLLPPTEQDHVSDVSLECF